MSDSTVPSQDPKVLAEEVYDVLMEGIEPELVRSVVPTLAEKYKDETAEEHAARMERYARAYLKWDEEFKSFMKDVERTAAEAKRKVRKEKESAARAEDQTAINSLTSAIG